MRKIPAIIVLPLLLASVALGQTSLFACSFTDHKVYEYTTAGVFVKAYERPGTPQFAPRDAVLSTDGVLYVANANGSIDAFSTTTAALLRSYDVQAVNNPLALAAGADGKLYISGGRTYGRLDAGTGHLDILFLKPDESFGIALRPDNGNLLLSNYPTPTTNAGSVLEYSLATSPPTLIGTFVPSLSVPAGMEFGPDGRLFISDLDLGKVFVAPATGGSPAVFASQNMNSPRDVTFDWEACGSPMTMALADTAIRREPSFRGFRATVLQALHPAPCSLPCQNPPLGSASLLPGYAR